MGKLQEMNMGSSKMNSNGTRVVPVNGRIYRTAGDESLLVLGVRTGGVFVEFADGRLKHISYREWDSLNPNPARC